METAVDDLIRPFRDSDLVVTRRWYRVPWGTPLLGFPSAFLSAHYEPFPWLPRDVGEVYPPHITYGRRRAPIGMTFDHVCGTREMWQRGAEFDPDFNSHPDEDWIPACCGRIEPPVRGGLQLGGAVDDLFTQFDAAEGGLQLGGDAGDVADQFDAAEGGLQLGGEAGSAQNYTDAAEGGLQLGGDAGDVADQFDAAEGGLQLGGEAGDDYTPGAPVPGGSCATAGTIAPGQFYAGSIASGGNDWFVFAVVSGTQYTITTTLSTPSNAIRSQGLEGANCGAATIVVSGWVGDGGGPFTASANDFGYIQVTGFAGGTYRVDLTSP